MPLHPQTQAVLAAMAALGEPPLEETTPEQARAARAARVRPSTEAVHEIRDFDADGVPVRFYRPAARTDIGLLVFFHGGGWVFGDLDSHDALCRSIANGSGHGVLSVDYRLAPEHPFPAALTDAVTAVRWAHAHARELGVRADRLAVGGDSAGGNLAAVVAQLQPAPLAYQVLVYPITDCTRQQPSYVDNADGYYLTASKMAWFIGHYLDGTPTSPGDPRVSPLFASDEVIAATPPALVITAEYDPLRDEGDAYAARLAAAGVPTSHVRFGGTIHGFVSLGASLDDGKAAVALIGAALGAALGR